MRLTKILGALSLAVLLAGCGGGEASGPLPAVPAVDPSQARVAGEHGYHVPDFAAQALHALNAARAHPKMCGEQTKPAVGVLSWSPNLAESAIAHSLDMAQNEFFSHTGSDGASSSARMARAGYPGHVTAEILAKPAASPSNQIVQRSIRAWLESPAHCAALMSPRLTQAGVACVASGTAAYFTVNLGG